MPVKKNIYCVEISDILEPEQEDFVIERVKDYVNKEKKALEEDFEKTDTIEIKRLLKEEAQNLAASLEGKDLSIRIYTIKEKTEEKEATQIKCPKCGFRLDYADWRCPECYYEFPDYERQGDEEESEE